MAPLEADLARVLAGDAAAVRALVAAFTPVIQARAMRALARRGGKSGRDPRQELGDLVQEVFLVLFRDGAHTLRAWDGAKGLSLLNFVGLVAEREVVRIASSGRRSPWALDPWADADLEEVAGAVESAEAGAGSRELFDRVCAQLEEELHPRAMELFRMLVVEEVPIPDVCAYSGLSADALYNWRSRLLKRAREIFAKVGDDSRGGWGVGGPIPTKGMRS
jgi:DNA-directed RNA polymerase specialized sigma24 family protein